MLSRSASHAKTFRQASVYMPQVWGGVGCCASLLLLALGDAQRSIALILFSMCTFLFAFSASYGIHKSDLANPPCA